MNCSHGGTENIQERGDGTIGPAAFYGLKPHVGYVLPRVCVCVGGRDR